MSSTTTPVTFSDLYTDLINKVRENSSLSGTVTLAKRAVNSALTDLHIMGAEKFPWSERRSTLTMHPSYTTGTVAVTVGSTTVTGTSTAWTSTNSYNQQNVRVGGKITFAGRFEVYDVTAVASATSLTISPAFIGTSDTDATYVYFEDEYELATDFARPIDLRAFDTEGTIKLIGRQDFRRMYPRNRIPQTRLRHATLIDLPFSGSTTAVRKVQFAPPPSVVAVIPYTYVTQYLAVSSAGTAQTALSADDDEPILPVRYRPVLVYGALVHWYRDRKDDPRSQEAKSEYEQMKNRIFGDMEIGGQKPRVIVNTGQKARAKRPYNMGHRGRFDMNGEFDRFE